MGLTFIDFFSGIGGFRLGMEMAGHKCLGHCEIDKFADKSYRAMHDVKEDEWYANDIRGVDLRDLPEADCWCGGFPCQSFSIAGKRTGFEDMRGTLIFEIFRLAAERKPKILFLENVAGLLNHDEGRTFATILCGLWKLGYYVQWQVLNSKDFGVPQNRERVFIVGHLGGTSGREVFPIEGQSGEPIKIAGKIAGKFRSRTDILDIKGSSTCLDTMQGGGHEPKVLVNVRNGALESREDFTCLDANYCKGLDNHGARTGVLEVRAVLTPDRLEKRQNGRRMKNPGEDMFTLTEQDKHGVMIYQTPRGNNKGGLKEIAPTITKNSYEHNNHLVQGTRIRRLIPKECFRLQGYPDEYFNRAAVVNSDSQLYKQAGNSVTVNVIYEIAKRL